MPWQNRVTPAGDLIATSARGTLTGNRGVLHDQHGVIVRRAQVRRWITCTLTFADRHRQVMAPNRYTHLFFLDEATALAAGHRPCAECRRADYEQFRRCWQVARAGGGLPSAAELDHVLHRERALVSGRRRTASMAAGSLPDGVMVEIWAGPWLVRGGELLRWAHSGYLERRAVPGGDVEVLTPPSTVAILIAGYRPVLHPSAAG